MSTLYDIISMKTIERRKWEISHSSLIRFKNASYEECRDYACKSITDGMTKISVNKGEILEIPYGVSFNFIGRVDTSHSEGNPSLYYKDYMDRDFISYSTICNQNISHYKGGIFLVYDIYPEDIVHIFPMDSDTKKDAREEEKLTLLPSLWLSLQDLNNFSNQCGVYNQVTVKTKRNGQIYKPFAVIAFERITDEITRVANSFEIGIIILHPDKKACNYDRDLLYDYFKLTDISTIMEKNYGFPVIQLYYLD